MDGKKVELHVHLDSSWRYSTLWEIARKRNISLPGIDSMADLKKACVVTEAIGLHHFLKPHRIIHPIYSGYLDAAERLAYEYCEDVSRLGVVYAEVRFVPQRLLGHELWTQLGYDGLDEVVNRVSAGLARAEQQFNIRTRMILIAMHGHPEWKVKDTLRLCQTRWDQGVVGLDMCTWQPGDEQIGRVEDTLRLCQTRWDQGVVGLDMCTWQPGDEQIDEAPVVEEVVSLMEEARKSGVYRTIHAGEVSGPAAVERAYYKLQSNRVGHGYHVVKDQKLYEKCIKDQVHFECCPYSSHLTAAVPQTVDKHPILRFAEDGANFSLSSDDPTMTGHYLDGDYRLAKGFGLNDKHLAQANINAAKAAFLQESEKKQLVREIRKSYGLEE